MSKEKKKTEAVKETPKQVVKEKTIETVAVEKSIEDASKEMMEMLKDNENVALAETAIQNNQIEFTEGEIKYRVRKTTMQEKQEANKFRMKRYIELLKDPDTLLERDLKKLYKNKGIDIDDIEKQYIELDKQQKVLMLDLGKAIKENRPKPELEKYKEEIITVSNTMQGLTQEKQGLLEYSLENRILMEVYSYMIWMIAEKQDLTK